MSEQIKTNDDSELLTWLLRYIHAHGTNGLSELPWTVTECNGEDSDIEFDRAAIRAAMSGTMPPLHQSMSEELEDAETLIDELVRALNLWGDEYMRMMQEAREIGHSEFNETPGMFIETRNALQLAEKWKEQKR
jgi:hypothetical protein